MSPHLSRDIDNDDLRHYRFVRNTGLPVGTFPRRERVQWPTADRVVCWAVVAIGAIAFFIIP